MQNYLERDFTVLSSAADTEGRMSVAALFDRCMDLAAEHGEHLGVGFRDMAKRGAFWVAVRTRIRIYEVPALMDAVRAKTWPLLSGRVKCDRCYRLTREDTLLAEGRTEWAGQNVDTGMPLRNDAFGYPTEMEHLTEKTCPAPFTRFKEQPQEENFLTTYTVGSRDIDIGHHMNNVAYVRALMGTFSVAELAAMDIEEVEIYYSAACLEGEELKVYRRQDEEGWHFLVQKPGDITAVQMAVRLR